MNQPWLTTSDWPVSALVGKAANISADARDVVGGGELAVDRLLEHHVLDHLAPR